MSYTDYLKMERNETTELCVKPRLLHVGSESTEPSWYNLEHSHNACELIFVLEGGETAAINGRHYEAKAGDTIIINSGCVHQEWGDMVSRRKCIVCTFDNFQLKGLPENHMHDKRDNPIVRPREDHTLLSQCFRLLLQESTWQNLYNYSMSHILLQQIIVILLRNVRNSAKTKKNFSAECECVKRYIDEHYMEKITLDDIAQQIFVSKGHLSHMFRMQTGEPPIRYLIRKRMEVAKQRLIETDDSIQLVAESVGYDSPVYFCQIFTKEVGIAPTLYRRKNRMTL